MRAFGSYLFWLSPVTPELLQLHTYVMQLFSPLRTANDHASWASDPYQQRMEREHGYANVMWAFQPHITLQRGNPRDACIPLLERDKEVLKRWRAVTIALVKLGEHGAVSKDGNIAVLGL